MKVARNAPAMPSTVVRMKPLGFFGPGEASRAITPATKPTMMTQRMPLMTIVLSGKAEFNGAKSRKPRPELDPAGEFGIGRQPSVRCQMIDHVGQMAAEARKQFVARQAALRHQVADLVGAERAG